MRFIQKRQESNRRTLRLRHWLLLLLRCLVIAAGRPGTGAPQREFQPVRQLDHHRGASALLVLLVGMLLLAGTVTRQGRCCWSGWRIVGAAALAGLLAMLIGTLRQSDASLIGDSASAGGGRHAVRFLAAHAIPPRESDTPGTGPGRWRTPSCASCRPTARWRCSIRAPSPPCSRSTCPRRARRSSVYRPPARRAPSISC